MAGPTLPRHAASKETTNNRGGVLPLITAIERWKAGNCTELGSRRSGILDKYDQT